MAKQKKNLLTIKKKVLVYLDSIPNKYGESWDAPFSLTQMGIANSVGISRQNVPRVVNALIKEGTVEARKVHIFGLRQKRYIYILTLKGREKAKGIAKTISETSVEIIYPDGSRDHHLIKDVPDILPHDHTITEILKNLNGSELDIGKISDSKESLKKKYSFDQSGLVEPKYFFGREKELSDILEWYGSPTPQSLIITGIAGIGKSTFLARAMKEWDKEPPVHFFKILPWTGINNILKSLGDFFSHLEFKELEYYADNNEKDMAELQVHLEKVLGKTGAILIFDDCHNANDDIITFFKFLFEILSVNGKGKMVCIGRSVPTFFDRGKATVSGMVKEVQLGGLDKEECSDLLEELGQGRENLDNLFRSTKGHPLFIELSEGKPINQSKNIKKYILDEYLNNLEDEERELLKWMAVFRYPVEEAALEPHHRILMSLLSKGVLQEMPNGTYRLHEIIRDYLYKIQRKKQLHHNHSEAAEYHIEQDDQPSIMEAIFHRIMADQLELAMELAVEHGKTLIGGGYSSDLCGHIELILDKLLTLKDEDKVRLISLLGDSLIFMGEWDRAIKHFDTLIELADITVSKEVIANSFMRRGKIHLRRDEADLSITDIKDALALYIELENNEGIAETMYQQGVIYERGRDYQKARDMFSECVRIAKNMDDQRILARSLNAKGRVYILEGNCDMALKFKDEALELFLLLNDQHELAKVYTGMGVCAFEIRDIKKAIHYHSKAAEISESIGDVRILGFAMLNLASSYIEKPDLIAAKNNLDMAKDIFLKLGEKRRLASVYMTYSVVYNYMERWDDATEAMNVSIQLFKEINDNNGLARANLRFGMIYKNMGKAERAIERINMALDYYTDAGDKNKINEAVRLLDSLADHS